jgi:hypothetical protein
LADDLALDFYLHSEQAGMARTAGLDGVILRTAPTLALGLLLKQGLGVFRHSTLDLIGKVVVHYPKDELPR